MFFGKTHLFSQITVKKTMTDSYYYANADYSSYHARKRFTDEYLYTTGENYGFTYDTRYSNITLENFFSNILISAETKRNARDTNPSQSSLLRESRTLELLNYAGATNCVR